MIDPLLTFLIHGLLRVLFGQGAVTSSFAMKSSLLALALVLSFSPAVEAQDLSKGFDAWRRGDYASALRVFQPLAEQGNAEAQLNLGLMYAFGKGVPRNYSFAEKWYGKAAEQGNGVAQFNLGRMYEEGQGVPQNYSEAYIWYSLAVSSGQLAVAQSRDRMAAKLTLGQLGDAQRESRRRWGRIQARKK
jgi:TPR repeat protein